MDDVELAVIAAWQRVAARIAGDDRALRRRLARRNAATLRRTPRAWCLALRANDQRITEWDFPIVPQHATRRDADADVRRHDVTFDADALRRLCAPVRLDAPGESLDHVAARLGTTKMGLRNARLNGTFRTHHMNSRFGRRLPLLYTDQPLDPAAPDFRPADPAWSWTASHLVNRVPDDFAQTLTRVPCCLPRGWRFAEDVLNLEGDSDADDDQLHRDAERAARRRARVRARQLPPPEPDHVWYKWTTDGVYLGDDPAFWRKSPQDPGVPPQPGEDRSWRKRKQNRPARPPRPSRASGSLVFRGWRWLCPVCARPARVLLCPLPPINLLAWDLRNRCGRNHNHDNDRFRGRPALPRWFIAAATAAQHQSSATPTPPPPPLRFACKQCSRVLHVGRCAPHWWNDVVSFLSGGLLYGREVPRPSWLSPRRRLTFAPRRRPLSAAAQRRRARVLELLKQGRAYADIRAALNLTRNQLKHVIEMLCKSHGLTSNGCPALSRHLGVALRARRAPTRDAIRRRLAAGQSHAAIAAALGIKASTVARYAHDLGRESPPATTPATARARVDSG